MKALFFTAAIIFSLNSISGNPDKEPFPNEENYCAKLKDGKVLVVHEDSPIAADVTLENGAKIKADGTVILKDGTAITLKEGQCMDKNGTLPSK